MLTASNGLYESRGPEGKGVGTTSQKAEVGASQSHGLLLVGSLRTSQGRPQLWPSAVLGSETVVTDT